MNEPKLRFPEFTDDWKSYKVSEVAEKTFGGGTPKTSNETFWIGDIPWIQSSDLVEGNLFDINPKKYISQEAINKSAAKLIPENSIAVVTRVGVGKLMFIPFSYATSQDFLSLSGLKTEPQFTSYSLYKRLQQDLCKVQGTSIKGITKNELLIKEIMVPSYEEQKKIGECLHSVDTLIQSAEKELEGYRELKQGMLQKMFPKKGEKVPEIRFPEFTGDWEQRKLGDTIPVVTDYVAAGSFADIAANVDYKSEPDYAQLVRTVDLKHNFENNDSIYVDKKAFDYLYRVNLDEESIVLPNIGANIGEVYYIEPSALPYERNVLGPNAIYLKPCKNTKFIYSLFQTVDFQKKLMISIASSGQPKFNKTELKEITITLPNNDEQKKIGEYFSNLDNLITLQQQELDGYKELKKGLLQQMFC